MSFAAESKITSLPRDRNPADAAAQGLSIVVPLFNEAASLERLHARLIEVAQRLGATRDLSCELLYIDDGSRDGTLAVARELPAIGLDVSGDFAVAEFRQGGGLAGRAGPCPPRRSIVHRWRWSASAVSHRDAGRPLAR